MNRFQIVCCIGQGSFSKVYKVKRIIDSKTYALKQMHLSSLTTEQKTRCLHEANLLSRITHPNIIEYKQAFIEGNNLCLVTELAQKGDLLKEMIRRKKIKQYFTEQQLCFLARQAANGLVGLHNAKILHRDVKPANYFLTSQDQVKLGDMNVSVCRIGMSTTRLGTPYYTSPQIWLQQPYSYMADMFAFGCVLYQLVTFTLPFHGRDQYQLKQAIINGNFQPLPETCPQKIKQIITKCLSVNPQNRLKAIQIVNDPIIKRTYNQYKQKTIQKKLVSFLPPMKCVKNMKDIFNRQLKLLDNLHTNYSNKKQSIKSTQLSKQTIKRPLSQRMKNIIAIYQNKYLFKSPKKNTKAIYLR